MLMEHGGGLMVLGVEYTSHVQNSFKSHQVLKS